MSAEVVLGLDAVLTIDGAEIKNVKDLTVNLEKAEADASTRANNGWRATVGTLKDASIEFTVLNKNGDTSFGMLQGTLEQRHSVRCRHFRCRRCANADLRSHELQRQSKPRRSRLGRCHTQADTVFSPVAG